MKIDKEKSIIGIKFHKENETDDFPVLNASVENFGLGEKLNFSNLNVSEFIDSQGLKLFREQCEHLEAFNLLEAIYLGDIRIYGDTLRCNANFIIANPSIKDDLESLIRNQKLDKKCLYSNLIKSNEIICIHSDELMFPAHSESCPAVGSFVIKMDNPCLVKVITLSNNKRKLSEVLSKCLNNN